MNIQRVSVIGNKRIKQMLCLFGICIWGVCTGYTGSSIYAQENADQDSTLLQDLSQNISNSSVSIFDSLQWADFQSHIPSRENKAFAVGEHLVFEIAINSLQRVRPP